MRVTDEQAKNQIKCAEYFDKHQACFEMNNCGKEACKSLPSPRNLSLDLLEARAMIREMRKLIYAASSYNVDCSCEACQNVKIGIREILEKSKEFV